MNNKKSIILLSIVIILSFLIGVSYAYFTPIVIGNDTASEHSVVSGSLRLTYNGTEYINVLNAKPSDYEERTFTVKNTGSLPVNNYTVNLSNLVNGFINNEMVYSLTCSSSDANPCTGVSNTPVPKLETEILTQPTINAGVTHTYTLRVTFIETGTLQDYNQEKQLSFKLMINELSITPNTMIAAHYDEGEWQPAGYFWDYRDDITSITFEDEIDIPVNSFKSWDVSTKKSGDIMAYIIDDESGNDTFKLYIQGNGNIIANADCSDFFSGLESVTEINNLHFLDTSNVVDMANMFIRCYGLNALNLSSFDTSSVTTMDGMFSDCSSLTSLDFRLADFTTVTTYTNMFTGITSGITITVKDSNAQGWITTRLTDVSKTGNVVIA